MQFGIFMFPTSYSMDPLALGPALEERGFESICFGEHTHIPTSRRTPYVMGEEIPEAFKHNLDPWLTLTVIATTTQHLKLGTAVSLVTQRDPIVLAKKIATLDVLSGGRVVFGAGAGWNREEMQDHGTQPGQRWAVFQERVEAMRMLWTQDEAEYHGSYVDFEPSWQWPKPLQRPHPPIYIGAEGRRVRELVVRIADGWMPIVGRDPDLAGSVAELQALAADAGRDPIRLSLLTFPPTVEQIEQFAEMGAERVLIAVDVDAAPGDGLLGALDDLARLIEPYVATAVP